MALPCGTTGSLCSSFLPDRVVSLPVKHPYAITLYDRLPIGLRVPLEASVTLLEATTPVKLPTKRCPSREVRPQTTEGWYFNWRLIATWRPRLEASHLCYTSDVQDQR